MTTQPSESCREVSSTALDVPGVRTSSPTHSQSPTGNLSPVLGDRELSRPNTQTDLQTSPSILKKTPPRRSLSDSGLKKPELHASIDEDGKFQSEDSSRMTEKRETLKRAVFAPGASLPFKQRGQLALQQNPTSGEADGVSSVEWGAQHSQATQHTLSSQNSGLGKIASNKSGFSNRSRQTLKDMVLGVKNIMTQKRPGILSRGMSKVPRNTWIQTEILRNLSASKRISLRIVANPNFETIMGAGVLLNCICLGVQNEKYSGDSACTLKELQLGLGDCQSEAVFYYLDYIFLLVFTAELVLKILANGAWETMGNMGGAFDATIVVVGWLTEIIIPLILIAASPDLKALQALKMLRVLRAVRVLRMAKFFNDLWFVVQSFFRCLRPLFWIMVFVFLFLFMFAILTINFIGKNKTFDHVVYEDGMTVKDRWSSTFRAMMTLFQIATLDEWHAILEPLFANGAWTYVFFIFYIAIAALALMNLVTAVVVDTSVRRTREENHAELQKQIFEQRVNSLVTDLQDLFESCDTDGSGMMEIEEFIQGAAEVPLLKKLCKMIGLEGKADMEELFKLMSGEEDQLNIEDFVDSVTKISQAANDRVAVAVIRTARSRADRLGQVKKIVERQPEVSTKIAELYDNCADVGLRTGQLQRDLASFKKTFQSRMHHLNQEVAELLGKPVGAEPSISRLHSDQFVELNDSLRHFSQSQATGSDMDLETVDELQDVASQVSKATSTSSSMHRSAAMPKRKVQSKSNVAVIRGPIFGQRQSQGLHALHTPSDGHTFSMSQKGRSANKPITPSVHPSAPLQGTRPPPTDDAANSENAIGRQRSASLDKGFRFR
eukprot:gnl/MRDRNA2_/MRDRNA2_81461_c0_seq1.p1 gnl/MRDRNA2_/MRDRNA2_81461_c0~~gnl/MRDRNA2_/MRDRNA2_81461_c0_seq1.p1  ORF type:complete len:835 (+),score=123.77 gnl/MRDRNA2_/MRDRNA2_81461_c0_seq1:104-2608(+)